MNPCITLFYLMVCQKHLHNQAFDAFCYPYNLVVFLSNFFAIGLLSAVNVTEDELYIRFVTYFDLYQAG